MRKKNYREDVRILKKECVFQGYFRIDRYTLQIKTFEDGWGPVVQREVFERGHAAAVLPYDPVRKKVVLIEQFRPGALEDRQSPWLLEIVAGILTEGEMPEEVAYRESQEEAGLDLDALVPIYEYYATPGACSERVKIFCGRVDAQEASGIHGLAEEAEDIKVHVLEIEKAFKLLHENAISNSAAIIALQWLELNHHHLWREE